MFPLSASQLSLLPLISELLAQVRFHLQGGNIYRLPHRVKEENVAAGW